MPTDRNLVKKEIATYASVLLEAARTAGKVFEVDAQLSDALSAVRSSMDLRNALEDMTFAPETRSAIVRELFSGFEPCLVSVLAVMAERGEIGLLSRVSEAYNLAAEDATKTAVVEITTAVALTDELRETIKKKLSAEFGGLDIVTRERVDKSIIGGIIMGAHGKRIDASIVSQLENARLALSTVPTGGEC